MLKAAVDAILDPLSTVGECPNASMARVLALRLASQRIRSGGSFDIAMGRYANALREVYGASVFAITWARRGSSEKFSSGALVEDWPARISRILRLSGNSRIELLSKDTRSELSRDGDLVTAALIPIEARRVSLEGALLIGWAQERHFSDIERIALDLLGQDLASAIEASIIDERLSFAVASRERLIGDARKQRDRIDIITSELERSRHLETIRAKQVEEIERIGALLDSEDSTTLLRAVTESLLSATGGAHAALLRADRKTRSLSPLSMASTESSPLASAEYPGQGEIVDKIAFSGQTFLIRDTSLHPQLPQLLPGFRSFLGVPLRWREEKLGALVVAHSEPGRFDDHSLDFAKSLGRLTALSIENTQLVGGSSEQAKDEFLSLVAHELRTPLTPMTMLLQSLERKAQEGLVDLDAIVRTRRQVVRLTKLISDLLDFSRTSAQSLELELCPLDLAQLASEVVDTFRTTSNKHEFELSLVDAPLFVFGERSRLEQVIVNLLDNAVKYSPTGGIIRLEAERNDSHITLSISDQGIGIPADQLSRLFDRFFRADNASNRKFQGFGLGLHLSRTIIERHLGWMDIESVVGQGSRFSFTLPTAECESVRHRPKTAPRVLLVDDDPDILHVVGDILEEEGYEVLRAHNGKEALRHVEASLPDLILLDLMMPVTDGWEVLERLRNRERWCQVPIIVLSAHNALAEQAEALHADGYLGKPFEMDALIRKMAELIPTTGSAPSSESGTSVSPLSQLSTR